MDIGRSFYFLPDKKVTMSFYSLCESLLSLKVLFPAWIETQSNNLYLFLIFSLKNNVKQKPNLKIYSRNSINTRVATLFPWLK